MKALIPSAGIDATYLARQLQALTPGIMLLVEESGHGTKALRTELFEQFRLLLPSRKEQEQITEYIESVSRRYSRAAELILESVDSLHEYRQGLITEAVTGQIDVNEDHLEEIAA